MFYVFFHVFMFYVGLLIVRLCLSVTRLARDLLQKFRTFDNLV